MKRTLFALWLLLLGLWIGADLGTGFFAAPAVFDAVGTTLEDSSGAGAIAGDIFARQVAFALVVLPVLLASAPLLWKGNYNRQYKLIEVILLLAFILVLIEFFYITPEIHSMREELGKLYESVSAAPEEDPLRARFGIMHGVSMGRALVEMILASLAFVLAARRPPP